MNKKTFLFIIIASFIVFLGVSTRIFSWQQKSQIITPTVTVTHKITQSIANPIAISIPKIQVNATVEEVGLDDKRRMDVPTRVQDVGWYKLGFKPGEKGSAVIDGHYDTVTGAPAVFYNIKQLQKGDSIITTDNSGNKYRFVVTNIKNYPYDQVPLQQIFNSTDTPRLNLITCAGIWDQGSKNYSQRTVVYTILQ